MRQIILDTETTGLSPKEGHRIVEIGAVEVVDRKLTGRTFHQYINPMCPVTDSVNIHGLTDEFLAGYPQFAAVVADFLQFVEGAELVIHNANFDMGFLEHELSLLAIKPSLASRCQVTDTLQMAREKFPGSRVSLDALCKRFGVDNSNRQVHGALLDAQLLTDVYLFLTGGQFDFGFDEHQHSQQQDLKLNAQQIASMVERLPPLAVSDEELNAHQVFLQGMQKKGSVVWAADLSGM